MGFEVAVPVVALWFVFAGCSTASECTLLPPLALRVVVRGPNGAVCDAIVKGQFKSQEFTLVAANPSRDDASNTCEYVGGSEPGMYVVNASRDGLEPATTMVTVGGDECHPITAFVELTMTPISDTGTRD